MGARDIARRVGVTGLLAVLSCSRPNPAYEDTGSSAEGSAGSTTSTTGDETLVPTTAGDGSASSGSSGAEANCGNGIVEQGEACDDDDPGLCTPDCRFPGDIEWLEPFQPTEFGLHRFNASALNGGDLIAVGRAVLGGNLPFTAVVARYDLEDGTLRSMGAMGEPWLESEAHAVREDGDLLYISGQGSLGAGFSSFVACFEVFDPQAPPQECWNTPLEGTVSRALALVPEGLLVTLGRFNSGGHGVVPVDFDGLPRGGWLVPTQNDTSRFEAVVELDDRPLVAGTMLTDAIFAELTLSADTTVPAASVSGTGPGMDGAQSMVLTDGGVILGGWLDNQGTGVDWWVGHYDFQGAPHWETVGDAGSLMADEVEGLALDLEGHVIAVGMTGTPSVATIWKFSVDNGEEIWSRRYADELPPGNSYFRSVEFDDDIFVVGEVRNGNDSLGIAMRVVP